MSRFPETENPGAWLLEFLLVRFRSYVEFLRLNEGVVNADRPASLDGELSQAGKISIRFQKYFQSPQPLSQDLAR